MPFGMTGLGRSEPRDQFAGHHTTREETTP